MCGTEVQYLHQLHVWDRVLLVQLFSYVGQRCSICIISICGTSFIGAYVSYVEQRCSICISCMCRTEFYGCISVMYGTKMQFAVTKVFMCGTEVQYLQVACV